MLYALWGTQEYIAFCGTQFRWPPEVVRRSPVGDLDAIIDREYWLAEHREGG